MTQTDPQIQLDDSNDGLCKGCPSCDFARDLRNATANAFFHQVGDAALGSFDVTVDGRTMTVTVTESF